ncbi:hypothetical protein [Falsiroseomonas sp. CW058]|uniref:hypothetical protein n=1 Tax=Falsiroseomonas sp. CW058 TaxID=3388664 RepID=UPI003D314F0D
MELFARLAKVHEEERVIHARALCEEPDRSGEVIDFDAAVTAFQQWSAEMKAASGGKSLGNVRVMHQPRVAGRIIDVMVKPDERAIDVAIKVDDEQIWQMCKTGAYTGLSIGGAYARKWTDPDRPTLTRYAPRLSEVSIVDRPCVPSATFQMLKADGSVEERHFPDGPSIDAELIDELRGRVASHNEAYPAAHQRTRLGDLKKAWERGAGVPGGGVVERHMRGMRRVEEHLSRLAKASPPIKPRTFGELRKAADRGNGAGAVAGAAVTGGIYGFVGRKLGGVALSPVTATLMAGSKRFRRAINTANDAYLGAKTGAKRAMRSSRPGLIASGIRHAVSRGRALDATRPGMRSVRGVLRVPGLAVGTGLGLYAFNRDLDRRRATKVDGSALQKRAAGRAMLARVPGGRIEAAGLAALGLGGAAIGGGAAAAVNARRGNPYRDESGRFTSKAKAVLVVGTGATLGALAGAAGGVAITRYGVRKMTQRAYKRLADIEKNEAKAVSDWGKAFANAKEKTSVEGAVRSMLERNAGRFEAEANRAIAAQDAINAAGEWEWIARRASPKGGGLTPGGEISSWVTPQAFRDAGETRKKSYEALKKEIDDLVRNEKVLREAAGSDPTPNVKSRLDEIAGKLSEKRPLLDAVEAEIASVRAEMPGLKSRLLGEVGERRRADKFLDRIVQEHEGRVDGLVALREEAKEWLATAPRTKSGKVPASAIRSIADEDLRAFMESGAYDRLESVYTSAAGRLTRPHTQEAKTASLAIRQRREAAQAAWDARRKSRISRRMVSDSVAATDGLISSRILSRARSTSSPMRRALRGLGDEARAAMRVFGISPNRRARGESAGGFSAALGRAKVQIKNAGKRAFFRIERDKAGRFTRDAEGNITGVGKPLWGRIGRVAAGIISGGGLATARAKTDLRYDVATSDKGEVSINFHYRDPADQSRRLLLGGITFPNDNVADPKLNYAVPGTVWRAPNSGGGGKGGGQINVSKEGAEKISKFLQQAANRSDAYDKRDEADYGVVFRREINDKGLNEVGKQAGQQIYDALAGDVNRARGQNGGKLKDDDFFDFLGRANGGVEFKMPNGKSASGSLLDVEQTANVVSLAMPGGDRIRNAAKDFRSARERGDDAAKRAAADRIVEAIKASIENSPVPTTDAELRAMNGAIKVFERRRWIDAVASADLMARVSERRSSALSAPADGIPF